MLRYTAVVAVCLAPVAALPDVFAACQTSQTKQGCAAAVAESIVDQSRACATEHSKQSDFLRCVSTFCTDQCSLIAKSHNEVDTDGTCSEMCEEKAISVKERLRKIKVEQEHAEKVAAAKAAEEARLQKVKEEAAAAAKAEAEAQAKAAVEAEAAAEEKAKEEAEAEAAARKKAQEEAEAEAKAKAEALEAAKEAAEAKAKEAADAKAKAEEAAEAAAAAAEKAHAAADKHAASLKAAPATVVAKDAVIAKDAIVAAATEAVAAPKAVKTAFLQKVAAGPLACEGVSKDDCPLAFAHAIVAGAKECHGKAEVDQASCMKVMCEHQCSEDSCKEMCETKASETMRKLPVETPVVTKSETVVVKTPVEETVANQAHQQLTLAKEDVDEAKKVTEVMFLVAKEGKSKQLTLALDDLAAARAAALRAAEGKVASSRISMRSAVSLAHLRTHVAARNAAAKLPSHTLALLQRYCPYCGAQCLEKCHSDGKTFTNCMGICEKLTKEGKNL